MKVITFTKGLVPGYSIALQLLDKDVEELGDVEIIDISDTLYPDGECPVLARRILYQEKPAP
jgi:hypothetical protein